MKKALIAGLSALVLAGSCMNAKGSDIFIRLGTPNYIGHSYSREHHHGHWNNSWNGYYNAPGWYYSPWQNPCWNMQPQFIVPARPVFPQPIQPGFGFYFRW